MPVRAGYSWFLLKKHVILNTLPRYHRAQHPLACGVWRFKTHYTTILESRAQQRTPTLLFSDEQPLLLLYYCCCKQLT